MKREIEIRMSTNTSVHREYANVGFIGTCRRLWKFWRHNGTRFDDYDEFRIRVLDTNKITEGNYRNECHTNHAHP